MSDTLIGIVGGVFISLIIGYFINWTSGPIAQKFRKWRDDQAQKKASKSVKNAKLRIERLEKNLSKLTGYTQNPASLNIIIFRGIITSLCLLIYGIFFSFLIIVINSDLMSTLFIPLIPFITKGIINITSSIVAILILVVFYAAIEVSFSTLKLLEDFLIFKKIEANTQKQIADLQEVIKKFEAV